MVRVYFVNFIGLGLWFSGVGEVGVLVIFESWGFLLVLFWWRFRKGLCCLFLGVKKIYRVLRGFGVFWVLLGFWVVWVGSGIAVGVFCFLVVVFVWRCLGRSGGGVFGSGIRCSRRVVFFFRRRSFRSSIGVAEISGSRERERSCSGFVRFISVRRVRCTVIECGGVLSIVYLDILYR